MNLKFYIFKIIFSSILINIINNYTETTDAFLIPDKNWKETECLPTYGAWVAMEKCVLYANVSPFMDTRKCWVFIGNGNKFSKCDILFTQPLIMNFTIILVRIIFAIIFLDTILLGYPFLFFKCIIFFIFGPILFLLEDIFYYFKTGSNIDIIFNYFIVLIIIKKMVKLHNNILSYNICLTLIKTGKPLFLRTT